MFEHLDDHAGGPTVDGRFRERTMRRGRRLRRRRRLAAGATACGSTLVLGAAGLTWWGREKLDDIDRVEVAEGVLAPDPGALDQPVNILVVGLDRELASQAGDPGGRADAIMVVRAHPATGRLSTLSVPRDLWVEDQDGAGRRINQVVLDGGPEALLVAVGSTLGIDLHHYVELDHTGFVELVDQVGGIDLSFPVPMRDVASGLAVDGTGCTTLSSADALALARSRHAEFLLPDAAWIADTNGDLARTMRQQAIAAALVAAVAELDPSPSDVLALLDVLAHDAVIDAGLSDGELVAWGRWLVGRQPSDVVATWLPVDLAEVDGMSVLVLDDGFDAAVGRFLAGEANASTPPPAPWPAGSSEPLNAPTPC